MRELPSGWARTRVGDLFDMQLGKMLSKEAAAGPSQREYLTNKNVQWNRLGFDELNRMSFSESEREKFRLVRGDLLVTEGGEVGRTAIWEEQRAECFFQKSLHRLRTRGVVEPRYMLHYMEHAARHGLFVDGVSQTSIAHLPQDKFAEHLVPHPVEVSEQQRIVDIIDAVSVQERAIEASIAKLKSVMAGASGAMLDEFVWDHTLADASDGAIRNGFSPVESEVWTGVQMLGLGCLTSAGFEPAQLKNAPSFVAAEHAAMLRDGDLLMSRANTRELVGLAGVYRDVGSPCIYPDLMMRIRPSRRCSVDFLATVLMSPRARRYIRSMAQGTSESMVKISASAVRRVPVPLPSLEAQARVLSSLSSISRQVDAENGELAKLQALKLGLVDDLLSSEA
ncbi:restriction endonuclease subunit S [Streptomyces sp. NPDC001728]|uniref:restriction endonuclease subunit S n=1 Tax=Streptomyces sp. NPDC001728 TaxID=3154396 RepID=UPI00331ECF9A